MARRAAVAWMVGFGVLHASWAILALTGVGSFTGTEAVTVNAVYTVVPLLGAAVAHAMGDQPGSVTPGSPLPPWFVRGAALLGSALLAFVATLATVHQAQIAAGALHQPPAWMAFEAYVQVGAVLFVPLAVRHVRGRPLAR